LIVTCPYGQVILEYFYKFRIAIKGGKKMNLLEKINNEISKRNSYGIREELIDQKGYILGWSNSAKGWYVCYHQISKGEKIRLDANEIFISANKKDMERIIKDFNELPLYKNSFEANYLG
jgi:hypothetical protein